MKRSSINHKKKIKTIITTKKLNKKEAKEEKTTKFSKFSLGKIEYAKIHSQVTRPLKQLQDLTEEKKNSLPCCGLSSQINGKLEPYKIFDNPDEFVNYGEGVVLFFSFYKFAIVVTFFVTIGISFVDSYVSYNYYYELRETCNNFNEDRANIYDDYLDIIFFIMRSIQWKMNAYFILMMILKIMNYKIFFFKLVC